MSLEPGRPPRIGMREVVERVVGGLLDVHLQRRNEPRGQKRKVKVILLSTKPKPRFLEMSNCLSPWNPRFFRPRMVHRGENF